MDVSVRDVGVILGGVPVLASVSLDAPAGSFAGVVGPNGSGKSTLLRAIARVQPPTRGTVHIGGQDLWRLPARRAAQRVAVVAQDPPADYELTVREIVTLGRLPHKALLERDTPADEALVAEALRHVGMLHAADRPIASLSGGERQRVHIARSLAQEPRVLVLDEPTNHLDIAAQIDTLALAAGSGATVVAALHDLNLAAAHCHHLTVLQAGRVVAAGAPTTVLTPELVREVFGVAVHTGTNRLTGRPLLAFGPLAHPTRDTDTETTYAQDPLPSHDVAGPGDGGPAGGRVQRRLPGLLRHRRNGQRPFAVPGHGDDLR